MVGSASSVSSAAAPAPDVPPPVPAPLPRHGRRAARPIELAGSFTHEGHRLAYTEFGAGDRVVVLAHGLMLTRRMHAPLARGLAHAGFRAVTLDLLGHGESDRPRESWQYSMTAFAEQTVGLLDHLDVDRAVVGGTSLGANVALEVAVAAPERLRGMVVEMPVLDNAIVAGLLAFTPLLFAARFAPLTVRAVAAVAHRVPHGNQWVDVVTDTLDQRPAEMAALIHGVLFGRIAPPRAARRRIEVPALVIGHQRDPVHPFGDADTLAADLPDAEFVQARSPVELRLAPTRLTEAITDFARRCHERR
ncbi:Pimeloyl-ACP methyl ester carboxylesterase [Amycolatopsis arida]|uniref:Pimeloyl-ACP methyl ester carboxylesterase n=1 Tax=Amycolatopsis arida TaxID=587909 RepID=A0A1I5ZPJ7_9PSEU|nr:alpha/beta fold hydrolase [Amycolatopsis arida]TDX89263.1 pimeloyl-ACP methyl ester carboxylesterase [Amycolatopsis arida]SFQ58416.1 Pimeloyl-ACP methyl ester carboxylesterase [Amycolatopsis arida]